MLPVAADSDTDGADGPVVSTLTVVVMVAVLLTLSVPVSVYR